MHFDQLTRFQQFDRMLKMAMANEPKKNIDSKCNTKNAFQDIESNLVSRCNCMKFKTKQIA